MSYYVEPKTVYVVIDGNTSMTIANGISLRKDAEQIATALNSNPELKVEDKIEAPITPLSST